MTPVAVFAYNRPAHIAAAMDALGRCDRLDECQVHVFCDGAKDEAGGAAVTATREVVRERAKALGAEVVEREVNLGLARSIVAGVTDLCERYGRVIVVEDDLVVAPDFLDFMLQALDRYADVGSVYQVSGFMFPVVHPEGADAFFLPLTTTWGWATWARAWEAFDWHATGAAEALRDPATRAAFDPYGDGRFFTMLADRLAGRNDSWGILWKWEVFRRGGLVLYPRLSLVRQMGWDGSGTHGGACAPYTQPPLEAFTATRLAPPIRLPEAVRPDAAAAERIRRFMPRVRRRGWLGNLRRVARRVAGGGRR